MCGRATLSTTPEELREAFGLTETPALAPRYNIAPSQPIAVIRATHSALNQGARTRRVELLRWGLVPSWAKDMKLGGKMNKMINARVESLKTRGACREALRARRALVLVDGFYEWQKRGAARQPFLVHRKDHAPFALAGLWDRWTSPSGEAIESCAIVTCPARPPCDALHDRMPLVVLPSAWDTWLDASIVDERLLDAILMRDDDVHDPDGRDTFVLREVSTRVNKPDNDDATCIEPASAKEPLAQHVGSQTNLFDYQR
jgi:putative SOS response-associated peptidase YedK